MTRLPQIERELVAAAGRRARPFPVRAAARVPRSVVPALVLAAVLAALVVMVTRDSDDPAVTAAPHRALVASAALTRMPPVLPSGRDDDRVRIPPGQIEATAAELQRQIPYPPAITDDFDWDDLEGMAAIDFRGDLQAVIEYRAACQWVRYWLFAHEGGDVEAERLATQVLADTVDWPATRGAGGDLREARRRIASAAARGDSTVLGNEVLANCR